jgi:hypothetical protein
LKTLASIRHQLSSKTLSHPQTIRTSSYALEVTRRFTIVMFTERAEIEAASRLCIIVAVRSAIPALVVFFGQDLQSIAKCFSFIDAHQSLDNLLKCSYLIRDYCACGKSSMDSELGSLS